MQSILYVHVEISTQRLKHFEDLEKVEPTFLSLSAKNQVYILLYGSQTNDSKSLNNEIPALKQLLVLMDN